MQKLVSVVVPIYKVEEYLTFCIQSIRTQTYQNLEIILVDDGSPDRCGRMCDSLAKEDQRIRVLHKSNGGLSDARNAGMSLCSGDYITFVDSDDALNPYFVETLMQQMLDDVDIVVCEPLLFEKDTELTKPFIHTKQGEILPVEIALRELLLQHNFEPSAWGKIYKTELFETIQWPKGKFYEDLATTYLLIDCARKVVRVPSPLYYYRQRTGSQMHTEFDTHMLDILEISDQMNAYIRKTHPQLTLAANARTISAYSHIEIRLPEDKKWLLLRMQIYQRIKELRSGQLLGNGIRLENKITVLLSFFGEAIFHSAMQMLSRFNH